MHLRGRRLKFTAVAVLVVLSLTGFSSGRGHGSSSSGSSDGGSGGGCSSSSQDHDSSSSTSGGGTYRDYDDDDYDDDSYGSGSTDSTAATLEDAEVTLLTCADADASYATIEVTNSNDQDGTFYANVTFKDVNGDTVDEQGVQVQVSARSVAKARVEIGDDLVGDVDHCEADPLATPST